MTTSDAPPPSGSSPSSPPPSGRGPDSATAMLLQTLAEREHTIARLQHDLDAVREILLEYIQARETAEDELRASEVRYRALILRAAYGIFQASLDGRFLEVNPALVRMLGHDGADTLLALPAGTVYYDRGEHQRITSQALAGDLRAGTEVRWRRRDGAPVLIRLTLQVVRDGVGSPTALEGIAEDVTERARQEEMLRRSERMASLGSMLAGVAHELNNPLAAIGGFAQLLLRETLSEDDRSAIETIYHESQRAAKIVRDLLAFSRRQEQERRERVDLNEIIRYIIDAQRYQIETQGIRRELELEPGLPPVLAQPSQLEQVVLNLVVNARQALESAADRRAAEQRAGNDGPAPVIAVRTSSRAGSVILEVEDNGPGIREEHRSRIWDPFWTTKDEGEGTGLGLAVVHGIISGYGGTIDVETEVGMGTRFIVKLPAAPPAPRDPSGAGNAASDPQTASPAPGSDAGGHITPAPSRPFQPETHAHAR